MTIEIATTTTLDFSEILPAERYEVWRESISVVFDIDSKTKIQPEVFNAELTTTHFSSILLNNTKSQGQNFNRSQKLIAQDDLDHFWLQMFIEGSSSGQWNRQQNSTVRPGDIFLIDFSQPFSLKTTNFEDINLIIPRHILQKYLPLRKFVTATPYFHKIMLFQIRKKNVIFILMIGFANFKALFWF